MTGLLIVFNQAVSEEILQMLDELDIRGFTKWDNLQGRGSKEGDPVMGTHTWPALNNAVLIVTKADKADQLTSELDSFNKKSKDQGLKVFQWEMKISVD